jgi:hypothetical protein
MPFECRFDKETFVDIDNDTLTFEVRLKNGNAIPSYFEFDLDNLILKGVPPASALF